MRLGWIAFLAIHIPLAILIYRVPGIATLHALITLVTGLWWAVSERRPERVAYVGAYIAGIEVLWRMAGTQIFYEFGKYATAAVFIVAMLRFRSLKGFAMPFLYFVLLLPSAALTLTNLEWAEARGQLSFNLSGPLALMVSAWFFSNLKISTDQLQRMFVALIAPVLGIAAITLIATYTASSVSFTDESNFVTSAGFGPNQVSAVLGLGALLAFFFLLDDKISQGLRITLFVSMIVLTAQSAMTFSRSGLYYAVGGAILASIYLFRDARSRIKLIVTIALLFVIVNYILFPRLDAFTGGALSARFQNVGTTGRDIIFQADLKIWQEHPVFGVGPGGAKLYREQFFDNVAAHTEFSRLLAEHGCFGVAALLLLIAMGSQSLMRAHLTRGRALTVAMITWSFLFMLGTAMRMVAPAFAFGLALATVLPEEKVEPIPAHRHILV
jgi:O-antigen ligase